MILSLYKECDSQSDVSTVYDSEDSHDSAGNDESHDSVAFDGGDSPGLFAPRGAGGDTLRSLLNASAGSECSCALRGIAEALEWPLQRPCGCSCWCRCYCTGAGRVGHTGLLQAASEHPVARLLLDNYHDQRPQVGGSPGLGAQLRRMAGGGASPQ
jgi:hypothetical protein